MSFRSRTLILAGVILIGTGALVATSHHGETPNLTAPSCQPDPSAQIAAIPSGGTFTGTGCYLVPTGIRLTRPVTINGGSYVDPSAALPSKGGFQPVLEVYETHDVTLENLSVTGGNPKGTYHGSLVGQAGIKLMSASHVTITNVSTYSTFGDGLELWAAGHKGPDTNVTVDGLTISTAGRNGISPSDVTDSTFTNVAITGWGLVAVDFESDLTGVGAGNLVFSNSTWGGTYFQEAITGPLTFTDCTLSNHVVLFARHPVEYPITFSGGSLSIGSKSGTAGVSANGPTNATFTGVTFSHQPTSKLGPLWNARGGAHLTFAHSTLVDPLGTNDASSTVTVLP